VEILPPWGQYLHIFLFYTYMGMKIASLRAK
jgi:hypothetical protein